MPALWDNWASGTVNERVRGRSHPPCSRYVVETQYFSLLTWVPIEYHVPLRCATRGTGAAV